MTEDSAPPCIWVSAAGATIISAPDSHDGTPLIRYVHGAIADKMEDAVNDIAAIADKMLEEMKDIAATADELLDALKVAFVALRDSGYDKGGSDGVHDTVAAAIAKTEETEK